jgi:hypothetical protein
MPFNLCYQSLPGLTAGADLSSSQYLVGKLASTAGKVVIAGALNSTTNPGAFVGVIMNKPASGEEVEFAFDGLVKVIAGTSTIAVGDRVWANSTGKLTDAGTTDNGFFLGRALEAAGAANDIISVKLSGNGGGRY